jgi:tetratricopeptide (TPR) repeat protein
MACAEEGAGGRRDAAGRRRREAQRDGNLVRARERCDDVDGAADRGDGRSVVPVLAQEGRIARPVASVMDGLGVEVQVVRAFVNAGDLVHGLPESVDRIVGVKEGAQEQRPSAGVMKPLGAPCVSTAFILWVQGRHERALLLEQRALAINRTALGPDHPITATVLDNLAAKLWALGRVTEALPLHRRALPVAEAALGPDHPDTAERLAALAATFAALGQHADALPLQQRALAITEAALDPDHPTTATRLGTLAATLDAFGRHADAAALRKRIPTATPSADDERRGGSGP